MAVWTIRAAKRQDKLLCLTSCPLSLVFPRKLGGEGKID